MRGQLGGVVGVGVGSQRPVAAHFLGNVAKVVRAAEIPQHGANVGLHRWSAGPPAFTHDGLRRRLCSDAIADPACPTAVWPDAGRKRRPMRQQQREHSLESCGK